MKEFILGDCMEGMKEYPDKFFDLAIVDPPYGTQQNAHRVKSRTKLAKTTDWGSFDWDSSIPEAEYFTQLFRISKHQIIWGGNYMIEHLKNTSCFLVWDKNNTGSFADCELAWTSFDTAVRMFKYTWNGMIQEDMKNKEVRIHPTQKPIPLYKWTLKNYAKPEFKIISTHVGSASDLIAFEDFGCEYIGFEIDPDKYNSALKRLNQHKAQLRMF